MLKITYSFLFLSLFASTFSFAQGSEQLEQAPTTTTIEFEETEFAWGEVFDGEKIQNVFTFTNTGNEPLIITRAKGSCGCTVPRFPKEPIMPGETADLLVQFDSKGKGKVKGAKQQKRVTITANTSPVNTYLTIKGMVFKKDEDEAVVRNENFDIDASQFKVFPNPTSNELNVGLKGFEGKQVLMEIYNALGQKMTDRTLESISDSQTNFDVRDFPKGSYTLSLKIEGKNRIARQFQVQ